MVVYCFPRVGELLASRWNEIDLNKALWTIPASHTKLKREHLVPLPFQMVAILRFLYEFEQGSIYRRLLMDNKYVFPTFLPRKQKEASLSEAALLKALNMIVVAGANDGVIIPSSTVHGFRHTASTFLHGMGFNTLVIEKQMAHLDPNKIRAIYNSYEYLDERREMLQKYADYLDTLRVGYKG